MESCDNILSYVDEHTMSRSSRSGRGRNWKQNEERNRRGGRDDENTDSRSRKSDRGRKRKQNAERKQSRKSRKPLNRKARGKISRSLSSILRHQARNMGLEVRPDGYVRVDDLLNLRKIRGSGCSLQDLTQIVAECEKQRFKLMEERGVAYIRANQGHSMAGIDANELLEQIKDATDIPTCIHGTYMKYWESIRRDGLSKMQRHHIHFTPSEVQTEEARSGFRKSCDLLIFINTAKAMEDGCLFFRSSNNVILSPGFDGVISAEYFSQVITRHDRKLVFPSTGGVQASEKEVT